MHKLSTSYPQVINMLCTSKTLIKQQKRRFSAFFPLPCINTISFVGTRPPATLSQKKCASSPVTRSIIPPLPVYLQPTGAKCTRSRTLRPVTKSLTRLRLFGYLLANCFSSRSRFNPQRPIFNCCYYKVINFACPVK